MPPSSTSAAARDACWRFSRGYRVLEGVDRGPGAVAVARARVAGPITIDDDWDRFFAGRGGAFDLVILKDVIYYVPRDKVVDALHAVRISLKPGDVAMARIGGLLALLMTGTNFSVSSGVGFLALFVVSVQTGVIMLEYINQLRVRRYSIEDAAVEGAVLRLRPIMMTMLVATLGLLPAALSHAIGSDSQRPFAIVIVGGLIAALVMSIFLLPTLYVWIASD